MKRGLKAQREALNTLIHSPRPTSKDHIYLMDVYDHLLRLVDNYHYLLAATLEVYLTSISNRMNEIMKILTIITIIIMMPLSVVAGIYGMNFHYMPELRSPYGYPAVLGGDTLNQCRNARLLPPQALAIDCQCSLQEGSGRSKIKRGAQ